MFLPSSVGSNKSPAALSAEEDKRRRNTEASARFRAKKKEREAALEKSARPSPLLCSLSHPRPTDVRPCLSCVEIDRRAPGPNSRSREGGRDSPKGEHLAQGSRHCRRGHQNRQAYLCLIKRGPLSLDRIAQDTPFPLRLFVSLGFSQQNTLQTTKTSLWNSFSTNNNSRPSDKTKRSGLEDRVVKPACASSLSPLSTLRISLS